ncbi:MAG: aldehyde oxidase and xanthine dehydrogenase, middle chain [Cyanobacteria bacterium RYN_339]|nr:aldehyde oxidase and xanthine dehydrogenase, middle chain [Cyanobacteria bacterium RYN_339]
MKFYQPNTLTEALELKARLGTDAYFLAGGTDLVVLRNRGRVKGEHWIDLSKVPALEGLTEQDGVLRIGAGTKHTALESTRFAALAEAAASVGGPQIRHRGTVGGNVGNASPAGDVSVALLAFDAEVELQNLGGARRMNLADFFLAPGKTAIAADEIITALYLPADTRSAWFKLGKREATAISVVCAAVGVNAQGKAHIALGSVAPRPTRVPQAEALIADKGLTPETAREAGRIVSETIVPITDHRATADYRRDVAGKMVARLLTQLCPN